MLDNVVFSANDSPMSGQLSMIQGDSLKLSARIPLTSFSAAVLPVVRFFAIDVPNPAQSSQSIGPKNFTVTSNLTLTTADLLLVLAPADTETLILDSNLGILLGLSLDDPRYYQAAKRFNWEIQMTGLAVNKSWQGTLVVATDFFKTNSSGTLPGLI